VAVATVLVRPVVDNSLLEEAASFVSLGSRYRFIMDARHNPGLLS
jgi:hypothetical protein